MADMNEKDDPQVEDIKDIERRRREEEERDGKRRPGDERSPGRTSGGKSNR